ncbi:bis(5'-nucleosyl)-tetraphosphatase (symmetrical) YqeK [Hutsoniella sourekii]
MDYQFDLIQVSRQELIESLEVVLSPKRFQHVLRVEETALAMADQPDVSPTDRERLSIAALMHDYAKELPSREMLSLARASSGDPDLSQGGHGVWHGPAGATIARDQLGCSDLLILEAIRDHTTGNFAMSWQSQVIFVADYIEPSRQFESAQRARDYVKAGRLEAAVLEKMVGSMASMVQKHQPLYPLSVAIYNEWTQKLKENV